MSVFELQMFEWKSWIHTNAPVINIERRQKTFDKESCFRLWKLREDELHNNQKQTSTVSSLVYY